jgi:hypothetical protein
MSELNDDWKHEFALMVARHPDEAIDIIRRYMFVKPEIDCDMGLLGLSYVFVPKGTSRFIVLNPAYVIPQPDQTYKIVDRKEAELYIIPRIIPTEDIIRSPNLDKPITKDAPCPN